MTLRGNQPDLAPGQWIKLRAVLTPPPQPVMPGAFNFQRRFYFMEIGATGFGLGPAKILADQNNSASTIPLAVSINLFVSELRQSVALKIRGVLPGAIGGVAAALMTGDRSGCVRCVSPIWFSPFACYIWPAYRSNCRASIWRVSVMFSSYSFLGPVPSNQKMGGFFCNFLVLFPVQLWPARLCRSSGRLLWLVWF